jgi:hypothetical protein
MVSIPCPLGDGGYDCTPFCPTCTGNQFIDVVDPYTQLGVCDNCNLNEWVQILDDGDLQLCSACG